MSYCEPLDAAVNLAGAVVSTGIRQATRIKSVIDSDSDWDGGSESEQESDGEVSAWQTPLLSWDKTDGIVRVCKNGWFSRVWTVQEFLFSRNPVFRMGEVECAAKDFLSYFSLGKNIVHRGDFNHHYGRTELRHSRRASDRRIPALFISKMVRLAALNNASDPRDKIYGLEA